MIISAIATAIGTAVGTAFTAGATALGLSTAAAGWVGFGTAFATSFALSAAGQFALNLGLSKLTGAIFGGSGGSSQTSQSPTYSFGPLQTQASNQLCRPRVYGKVKCAGNIIWQNSHTSSTVKRIICFADGEINGFSNVLFNDNKVDDLPECSFTPYTGNGSQLIDSRVPGSTQADKAKIVGGLKYDAYLAVTAVASEKLNGGFNVTAEIEGSKVRVYSDPTQFDIVYSNNPAWCILDFLTCYNGCGISFDEIDIQSFLDAAEYCDVDIISNGSGTINTNSGSKTVSGTNTKFKTELCVGAKIVVNNEAKTVSNITSDTSLQVDGNFQNTNITKSYLVKQKRFTLNIILDVRQSRLDWLDHMLVCCRGYIAFQNGKISLKIEQDEPTTQVFTPDNIITGSEKFWTTPREQRYDVVKVQFIDPNNQYVRIFAQAEVPTPQNEQPIVNEIEAYGITSFNQASRLAWFYLNQSITCNKFITFQTTKEGLDRSPGDVIEVTSTFLGYVNKKMRIIHMAETQEGQIEIVCKEYNLDLYSDELGSAAPVYDVSSLGNAFAPPPAVIDVKVSEIGWMNKDGVHISNIDVSWDEIDYQFLNHYAIKISEDNGATWKDAGTSLNGSFRIKSLKTSQSYKVSVQAVNHQNIFSDQTISNSITITGKDDPPPNITTFTAIIDPIDRTRIKLNWSKVDIVDLKGYEVREGISWDLGTPITSLLYNTQEYTYIICENKTHYFHIKAVDNSGNYSINPLTASVDGKVNPDDVIGFMALQNGSNALLTWTKSLNPDVIGYEIREGASFDLGALVITGLTNNTYEIPVDTEKTYLYHIKAINRAGYYSLNAASSAITVSNLPPKNVIEYYDELSLESGTHDQTEFGSSSINFSNLGGQFNNWTTTRFNEVGGTTVLKLAQTEGQYYSSGTYTCTRKDMEQIITANIASEFASTVLLFSDLGAKLQFRTSTDGINFTEWKDFAPILATFRYIDFRAVLSTNDISKTPEITILKEKIDVPDTIKRGSNLIAVGGTTINYNYNYYELPHVTASAVGAGLRAEIQSKNNSSFTVKVFDASNVDKGGNIDWQVIGY